MGEISEKHYQRVPGEENTAADKNLPDNGTSATRASQAARGRGAGGAPPSALSPAPGDAERASPKR